MSDLPLRDPKEGYRALIAQVATRIMHLIDEGGVKPCAEVVMAFGLLHAAGCKSLGVEKEVMLGAIGDAYDNSEVYLPEAQEPQGSEP